MRKYLLLFLLALSMFGQTLPNAVPLPLPEFQFADSNGAPLAGGLLYTYAAGTSTPLATYTDSTGMVSNTNPIVLDSAGRASIWIGAAGYKLILRNADGVQQWSQDNVIDTVLYFVNYVRTAGTSTLITYTNPRTGAVLRTVSNRLAESIYAKDFGAVCDGSIDDKAAIQLAIDSLNSVGGVVKLPQNSICRINSTLTIPSEYFVLDCQGSQLKYTLATGDAILVSPFASDVPYISGGIRDCWINEGTGAPAASTGIHMQSRLGFQYLNVRIKGFNGVNGSCMYWENTASGPQFTEQNTIDGMDSFDCTRHLKFANTGGTNSFMYNYITNWHCGTLGGQYCLSLEGNGTPNNILVFGSYLDLRVNGNGSTAMRILSATGGSVIERKTVNITGELTTGIGPFYSLYSDSSSEINVNGYLNVTGSSTFSGGSQSFTSITLPLDPATNAAIYRAGGGIIPQRKCLYALGYPNANVANGGDATFWLANNGGVENNCHFQILARTTDPTNVDVNITGSGPLPVNILFADPLSRNVGIGTGFSDSARPGQPIDINGNARLSGNLMIGNGPFKSSHIVTSLANSDLSFQLLIPSGSLTNSFAFSAAYNNPPTCVATPNTIILGMGGVGAGQYGMNVAVNQVTMTLQFTQGVPVTFFIMCAGNPN